MGRFTAIENVSGIPAAVESFSKTLVVETLAFTALNAGLIYASTHKFFSVNKNATVSMLVKVPGNTLVYAIFDGAGEDLVEIDLYEGPTITTNGTPIDRIDRNRNNISVPVVEVYHTPTTSASGTLLVDQRISKGSVSGPQSFSNDDKWVLAENQNYLMDATNITKKQDIQVGILWFEYFDPAEPRIN